MRDLPPSILWSAGSTAFFGSALLAALLLRGKSSKDKDESCVPGKEAVSCDNSVEGALDKEKYPGGHLTVVFASQTGTAESFATQLQQEGETQGFKVRVLDMEEIESANDVQEVLLHRDYLDENDSRCRVVIVAATYGEGEATDNAEKFHRLLKVKRGLSLSKEEEEAEAEGGGDAAAEEKDLTFLSNVDYAVFGLGNTQYEHFNAMGKFFDQSFHELGATRLLELGLGDDDQDLEGDFETWKDTSFWPTLKEKFCASSGGGMSASLEQGALPPSLPLCPYRVEYVPELKGQTNLTCDIIPPERVHKSTRHYFTAVDCPITASRELRSPKDTGSTLHVEIDVSCGKDDALKYNSADNLGILPINDSAVVQSVARALGLDLDAVFRLKPSDASGVSEESFEHLFPTPCTVRDCLSRYCDLTTPPRRSELKLLSNYASDPLDKKALERMASKEGKAEYREKIIDAHVGTADIVSNFCPSIVMSLEELIAACPRLQPRFYTISSSSSVHPESVHITLSVLEGKKANGMSYKGVCTGHIAGLKEEDTCRVFLRHSAFRLPSNPLKPVIMIGPGTGIAPMRALLQERAYQKKTQSVGKNILYFGCRRRDTDYIYQNELTSYEKDGTLSQLHVAFSREQKEKVYVQHLLEKNADETWKLIDEEGASVYVCGGTKMGLDVTETVVKMVQKFGAKDVDGAKAYVEVLRSEGRFVQELWS